MDLLQRRAARSAGLLILACAAAAHAAAAQIVPRGPGGTPIPQVPVPQTEAVPLVLPGAGDTSMPAQPASRLPVLLEGPIGRTEYRLGPGDVLTLSLFGYRNQVVAVEVAPEGTIVVPEVGVVQVGGMNLDEAERAAAVEVRRYLDDTEVNLSLRTLRSFVVFIVGDVPEPGARQATPVTRVSELIQPITEEGVIHRNVVIGRRNGETEIADLAGFLLTGDLAHNPTVRAGDVVRVPPIDRTISVYGRVAYPGVYEYREGESLAELLRLANGNGPFPADASDTIRIQRFTTDPQGEVHVLSAGEALGTTGASMPMRPFDALFVPRIAHFGRQRSVAITGEVGRPGEYPIVPGVTTVAELVEMAGGLTAEASLRDALLRREAPEIPGGTETQLQTIPPEMLSREELRILQVTNRSDAENVVLDLGSLSAGLPDSRQVVLRDGDRLHVPELREEVVVLGAVHTPGIVAHTPGQPADYFIALAGGYTERADRGEVTVLRGRLRNPLTPRDITGIEPGDQVVVPFEQPRTVLERIQTVEGVAGTISGLLLSIIAIERLWN